jgi:hypothetical protein
MNGDKSGVIMMLLTRTTCVVEVFQEMDELILTIAGTILSRIHGIIQSQFVRFL